MTEFKSAEEAVQFLADEVSRLSRRVYDLENKNMAQRSAISVIVAIVGQLPPFSVKMIQDALTSHADALVDGVADDETAHIRAMAVAAELRSFAAFDAAKPAFQVIDGGRKD